MAQGMLTSPGGPVVAGRRTMDALAAVRKETMLPRLFGSIRVARSSAGASPAWMDAGYDWLIVEDDRPSQPLPERLAYLDAGDAATLRLALGLPASLVLLENPVKDKARLNFIKAQGALAVLVQAYRQGYLSAVEPMVKAWRTLGYDDVLPEEAALEHLWRALRQLS